MLKDSGNNPPALPSSIKELLSVVSLRHCGVVRTLACCILCMSLTVQPSPCKHVCKNHLI